MGAGTWNPLILYSKMKNELHRAVAIWQLLVQDTELSAYVSVEDLLYVRRRASAEGMKFMTVTLPSLGKALDSAFESGKLVLPDGWRPAKDHVYPSFLKRAWGELFTPQGEPRWVVPGTTDNIPYFLLEGMGAAVACIRQLTYAFYKYTQPWTDEQAEETFSAFKRTEADLSELLVAVEQGAWRTTKIGNLTVDAFINRARRLICGLLSGTAPKTAIVPRYATGATADRATAHGRWEKPRLIPRLDKVYPYSEWFVSGINGLESILTKEGLDLEIADSPGARVVLVPKDSRGPRLISAEPREFMYIQQGLMDLLYDTMERYPIVRAQVSCTDQTRNQRLALLASQLGALATLDMKEASDRVSLELVRRLFPSDWVEAFEACRSTYTVLPSGEEVPLLKFAPMGSSVCFPVEALVFWALCHAASPTWSDRAVKRLLTRSGCKHVTDGNYVPGELGAVSVFGDDIIVPTQNVDTVVQLLEAVGLKVNSHKSFRKGPFRESCGADYFAGVWTTPVRVKSSLVGDDIVSLFRVKDTLNSICRRYGHISPQLIGKARELYQEFFGVTLPVFPSKEEYVTGLCLTDTHWLQRLEGQTLKKNRQRGWQLINVRVRAHVRDWSKPDYNRLEARLLTEVPVREYHDLNWCSVLRAFLVKDARGGAGEYAIRRRVHYRTTWVGV